MCCAGRKGCGGDINLSLPPLLAQDGGPCQEGFVGDHEAQARKRKHR